MSTGEASGDMLAAALAEAMRAREPAIAFEGIGSERMGAAGFKLTLRTGGRRRLGQHGSVRCIGEDRASVARRRISGRAFALAARRPRRSGRFRGTESSPLESPARSRLSRADPVLRP